MLELSRQKYIVQIAFLAFSIPVNRRTERTIDYAGNVSDPRAFFLTYRKVPNVSPYEIYTSGGKRTIDYGE